MEYRIASCTLSFAYIEEYQIKVFQIKNKQRLRAKITDDLLILWPGHPGRPDKAWACYTPNTFCWYSDLPPICLPLQLNDMKVDLKITKSKGRQRKNGCRTGGNKASGHGDKDDDNNNAVNDKRKGRTKGQNSLV